MVFTRRINLYFFCALISGVAGTLLYRTPIFEKQELICGFLFGAGAVLLLHGCWLFLRSVIYFLRSLLWASQSICDIDTEVTEDE